MSFEYIKNKFPTDDGFCMPAEFSKHSATVMIWPERPGSWCYEAKFAEKVFAEIIGKWLLGSSYGPQPRGRHLANRTLCRLAEGHEARRAPEPA